VDGALTYGEYELGHFCALIERACADRPGGLEGATLLDCGSGCGRLVVAASALWPEMERAIGIEKVEPLHSDRHTLTAAAPNPHPVNSTNPYQPISSPQPNPNPRWSRYTRWASQPWPKCPQSSRPG